MQSSIQDRTRQLLAEKDVVGVLGLREISGSVAPHVFTAVQEAALLVTEPKWPLAKTAWRIASTMPDGKILGLICRSCDLRAIEELVKAGQLRMGAVRPIGYSCSPEQAEACLCDSPAIPGYETSARDASISEAKPETGPEPGRLDAWQEHFSRCIKCYGCRNACPICVCPECKLEDDGYVTLGMVPPEPLAFHLIRAMHMADRCVGCGACQESCPAGLPLLTLHLGLRKSLRERTGYVSGTPALSPFLTAGREEDNTGTAPLWEDTLKSERSGGHA